MRTIKILKEHFYTILLILAVVYLIKLYFLPEYQIYNSWSTSSDNGQLRETILNVIVYKAQYNQYLYYDIEEEHNRINGTPTILTLKLYKSEKAIKKGGTPYRTVVFDYPRNLRYILLN